MQLRFQDGRLRRSVMTLTARLICCCVIDLGRQSRQLQLEIKAKPLLCRGGGRGWWRFVPPSRPPAPDVLLSPCPIMLDNCMAHHRLHPCPLDIKGAVPAGFWALHSFELVRDTKVTQASAAQYFTIYRSTQRPSVTCGTLG